MPRKMVEEFWSHYAAVGFVDAAGRELCNLKAALAKWKTKQEAGPMMRGGVGRQASAMDLERSIGAARAELAAMPAKDEPSFPGDAARTPEQRERAGVLKARIREWQRQMAGG